MKKIKKPEKPGAKWNRIMRKINQNPVEKSKKEKMKLLNSIID